LVDSGMGSVDHVLAAGARKLIAIGLSATGGLLELHQYLPDGSLDPSFDGDGIVRTDKASLPWAALLQSDGKILVFADAPADDATSLLVRFNADGSFDKSFGGGDGIADPQSGVGVIREMEQQPDGKIVALGNYRTDGTQRAQAALWRYDTDGSLDPTFYGGG